MSGPTTATFPELAPEPPDLDALDDRLDALIAPWADPESDADARRQALDEFEASSRRIQTWFAVTHIRFTCDTQDEEYERLNDLADELWPRLESVRNRWHRALLESPHREHLASIYPDTVLEGWQAAIDRHDPAIEPRMEHELELTSSYTKLRAAAKVEFEGEALNLAGVARYFTDADRDRRHRAHQTYWAWFGAHREELDETFDALVDERHAIAQELGFDSFTPVGYLRMTRLGYGPDDVARFRTAVERHVVPLAEALRDRQAAEAGIEHVMLWDEPVFGLEPPPEPGGDADWVVERASRMFDGMHDDLSEFFAAMRTRQMLDLETRDGKASGGYCYMVSEMGLPFVFANFNETAGDIRTLTHEMGHAYQAWSVRDEPWHDNRHATAEACEVHAMSMEYLTWPWLDAFFGEEAEAARTWHLSRALCFLPYCVTVDHFQHDVYASPDADANKRGEMWLRREGQYMPWRDAGDIEHVASGRYWQSQMHVYQMPFYYIDYGLALTCALQFWAWSRRDHEAALDAYRSLCARGGRQRFEALVEDVGLRSPFREDCLADVVREAAEFLELRT